VIVVIDASVAIMWVLEDGSAAAFALKEEDINRPILLAGRSSKRPMASRDDERDHG